MKVKQIFADLESLQFYLCDESDPNRARKAVFEEIGTSAIDWVKRLGAERPQNTDRPFKSVIGLDGNNVYAATAGDSESSFRYSFSTGHENFNKRFLCMGQNLVCEEGLFPHNYASTCDKSNKCGRRDYGENSWIGGEGGFCRGANEPERESCSCDMPEDVKIWHGDTSVVSLTNSLANLINHKQNWRLILPFSLISVRYVPTATKLC